MAGNVLVPNMGFIEVGVETAYGTEQTTRKALPLTSEPTVEPVRQNVQRDRVKPTQGGIPHGVIPQKCTFSFQVAVQPVEFLDGAAPAVGALLQMAGMSEALSGAVASNDIAAVYNFLSVGMASGTIKVFRRDKDTGNFTSILLLGARCNVSLTVGDNAELLLDVTGEALYDEWSAVASATISSPNSEVPFITYNETLTHHGKTVDVASFDVSTNWSINNRIDHLGPNYYVKEVFLARGTSGQRPNGTYAFTALDDYLDPNDWMDDVREAGASQLTYTITSPDTNQVITISAPKAQVDAPSWSDAGEYYRFSAPFMCNEDAGDDDLEIKFERTAA